MRSDQYVEQCDGRVIIDAGAYYRENPGARRKLAALTSTTTAPNLSDEDDEHGDLYSSWESKDSFHYPFDRTYGLARIEVHPKQGSGKEWPRDSTSQHKNPLLTIHNKRMSMT